MAGRRSMEKDAPKRSETPSEVGAASTGDSNVQRWHVDAPRPQGGEPSKSEGGNQVPDAAAFARQLAGSAEHLSAQTGENKELPSILRLGELKKELDDINDGISEDVRKAAEKTERILTDLNAAPSPLNALGAIIGSEIVKKDLRLKIVDKEQKTRDIGEELRGIEGRLAGEVAQGLKGEREKLEGVLEDEGNKLAKATPEELRAGLQQIPEEQRDQLMKILEGSSQAIRAQREFLNQESANLQTMEGKLATTTSESARKKLEKEVRAKKAMLDELGTTIQTMEAMERSLMGVKEQGQALSASRSEQGGHS